MHGRLESVAALKGNPGRTLPAPTPETADPVDGRQARSLVMFSKKSRWLSIVTGYSVFVSSKQDS